MAGQRTMFLVLVAAIGCSSAWMDEAPPAAMVPCDANPNPDQPGAIAKVCDQFCARKCDFNNASELPNGQAQPHTMIVYRETPVNVTGLAEKDCGDEYGDVGFYLANHNMDYLCTAFPNSSDCTDSNAIEKGSQNNIFVKYEVEVDGDFGPYSMCNPLHGWDTKHWECLTYCEQPPNCPPWSSQKSQMGWMGPTCFCDNGRSNRTVGRHDQSNMGHHHGSSKDWPPVCAAADLSDISSFGYCLNGTVLETIKNSSIAECCTACANKSSACGGWNMPAGKHGDCYLISQADHDWHPVGPKNPCVSAYKFDGGVGHISDGALGGYWYSMPAAGECAAGQRPGRNGSTCTWRTVKEVKQVNITCVNDNVDAVVEAHGKQCFSKCAEPTNEKTACYAKCFAQTINGNTTAKVVPMDHELVVAPFLAAFASNDPAKGGCRDIRHKAATPLLLN